MSKRGFDFRLRCYFCGMSYWHTYFMLILKQKACVSIKFQAIKIMTLGMKREFQFLLYIKNIHLSSFVEIFGSAPLEQRTTLSPLLDWGCRSCETDIRKRRSSVGVVRIFWGVNQKSKKPTEFVLTHRNGEKTPSLKLTEKKETENMPKLPKEGQILSNGFFWSQNVTRFK